MSSLEDGTPLGFHDFPFTPKIIEEVKKGLPYFSAGAVGTPKLLDMLKQYRQEPDTP